MASEKIQGVLDTIGALSVGEFIELSKALQSLWGVTPSVGRTQSIDPNPDVEAIESDVQTEFAVILKDAGAQKIQVIKAIREVRPGLGLKEAKDLADNTPIAVVEAVPREEAMKVLEKLGGAGAVVAME